MKHLGRTPPFRSADGDRLPGSIAEVAYLPLGGLDQWVFEERRWVQRLVGESSARTAWALAQLIFASKEYSIVDVPNIIRGFRFTLDAMWPEVSRVNLFERAPALQMPVFFCVGRRDRWVPPETSVVYFEALNAPSKKLVWFEHSAHEAVVDEPEEFNRAMVQIVRPAVVAASPTASRVA